MERFIRPDERAGRGPFRPTPLTVNTSTFRYRKLAKRRPHYTDLASTAPGGTSAAESLENIKQSYIGLASQPFTDRHSLAPAPAYFPQLRQTRDTGAAAQKAAAFLGPGKSRVAYEHNRLPSFPLLY